MNVTSIEKENPMLTRASHMRYLHLTLAIFIQDVVILLAAADLPDRLILWEKRHSSEKRPTLYLASMEIRTAFDTATQAHSQNSERSTSAWLDHFKHCFGKWPVCKERPLSKTSTAPSLLQDASAKGASKLLDFDLKWQSWHMWSRSG